MEPKLQEALNYPREFPDAKVIIVARDFGVNRSTLQDRLKRQ